MLESFEDASALPLPILILLAPLSLPLYASPYGSALTALLFLLAVACLIIRYRRAFRSHHTLTALIGIALIGINAARVCFMAGPSTLETSTLWETIKSHPILGQAGSYQITPPTEFHRLLLDYGFGGLALLSRSLEWYVYRTWRTIEPRPILPWWCWIGCLMVGMIVLWEIPLAHPVITLMTILLFVSGMALGNLHAATSARESFARVARRTRD
ncbi:MAG: hypothetical protein ACI8T1_005120 [Verrucomicrobiales bacterium]|jgi:hypothetical protein